MLIEEAAKKLKCRKLTELPRKTRTRPPKPSRRQANSRRITTKNSHRRSARKLTELPRKPGKTTEAKPKARELPRKMKMQVRNKESYQAILPATPDLALPVTTTVRAPSETHCFGKIPVDWDVRIYTPWSAKGKTYIGWTPGFGPCSMASG